MKRFEHKTVLITGGSSGIGLAGAERLITEGAKVIVTGRTGQHLKEASRRLGRSAIVIEDDVTDGKSPERLVSVVREQGPLDGLWLNAAYAAAEPLESLSEAALSQMFAVNVIAPMLQMGALSPFVQTGGAVVVTSSSAVYEGQPSISAYAASKAAVLAAARSWAAELAPRNIRVNSIVPGPIKSNLRSGMPEKLRTQFEEDLAQTLLLQRIGEPEEAAAVALFLLSGKAGYVTGSSYTVDGGLLML